MLCQVGEQAAWLVSNGYPTWADCSRQPAENNAHMSKSCFFNTLTTPLNFLNASVSLLPTGNIANHKDNEPYPSNTSPQNHCSSSISPSRLQFFNLHLMYSLSSNHRKRVVLFTAHLWSVCVSQVSFLLFAIFYHFIRHRAPELQTKHRPLIKPWQVYNTSRSAEVSLSKTERLLYVYDTEPFLNPSQAQTKPEPFNITACHWFIDFLFNRGDEPRSSFAWFSFHCHDDPPLPDQRESSKLFGQAYYLLPLLPVSWPHGSGGIISKLSLFGFESPINQTLALCKTGISLSLFFCLFVFSRLSSVPKNVFHSCFILGLC